MITVAEKSSNRSQTLLIRDINLSEYFNVIKKRLWLIALIVIITASAGYYYNQLNNVSLYQSSTRMIISSDSEYTKTLMVMIKDPIVMGNVINELKLEKSPQGLASQIEVMRIDESQVVQVLVTDTNPQRAASIANITAKAFKSEANAILDFKDIQLLSGAIVNPSPINESQNKTILFAAGFGLIVGVGLAFFLESLDGTIRREKEVEDLLGIPVIGVVPNLNKKKLLMQKRNSSTLKLRGEIIDIKKKASGNDS
ncbi:Wzz/FepE/Etk N-terminal domain-containing protein [Jeotgalibacillus sp. S-D1]|uniref:YveK family protein n=1 Tax=Jeotgalibacillus sp. S-D1 TaxID=2552189 RepID=UPI001F0F5E70|nr:Wzz/FepE/Etk N-terminal domain-containing protein [Jeotgalibacillus sp. S-D1]